jgi:DNA helicase-2/ATP-dependent DNA helicase PcrA
MPPHYNPVRDDEELLAFPATIENFDQDFDAHKAHVRALGELDERRLAYVALTRAQHTALVCGSWWGSTQSRRRGPSDFLTQLRESATSVVEWFSDPGTQAKNPALVARVHPVWPKHGNEIRAQLAEQRDILSSTAAIEQLSAQELAQVQSWDNDIAAVKEQVMRAASQSRTVRLPASLSASQLIALGKNPAEFLEALIRPMPRKPSVAADRGVAFHAWLESFYAKPGMFNPEDLPGAGDDSIYSDDQLEQLKESFGQGLFASRAPHFMELPFALVVGGRTIRGRIDAVFTGSIDNASDESRWLIVDWKTGSQGNSDPLQLHIYRHAWAQIHGIEPTQIDAAFYYVSEKVLDVVEPSVSFRDIELALLGGREFTDHE